MAKNLFETGQEPTQVKVEPVQEPLQEETVEEVIEETKDWNKEKAVESYKGLQRKITERELLLKEAEERAIRAEERAKLLEEMATKAPLKAEEKVIVPEKPVKPNRPNGYNKADAIAYPESESAKYDEALEAYYEKKDVYDNWREQELFKRVDGVAQTFEERKNEELRAQEFAQRKAAHITRLAKATGGDIEKASKVFDYVQEAMVKDDPSWYVKMYDLAKTDPQQALKNQNANSRKERQETTFRPVSTLNSNLNEADEQTSFISELKGRRVVSHDLFATEKRH